MIEYDDGDREELREAGVRAILDLRDKPDEEGVWLDARRW